ncbi:MAG: hypothetical protein ACR2Q3_00610, partial [Woeseiaceae bacterium]
MRLLTLSRASAALLPALALLLMAPIAAAENDEDKEPGLPLEGKTEKLNFTTGEGSWLAVDVVPDGELLVFDLLGD